MSDSLSDLLASVRAFRDERDWAQFHTPRNLAAALSIEAGELQELMLWKTDEQVKDGLADTTNREKISHEIADVLIYLLLLSDAVDVNPAEAVRDKLAVNASKYPVDRARGNAMKYTQL